MKFLKQIFFYAIVLSQIQFNNTLAMETPSPGPQEEDQEVADIFFLSKPNIDLTQELLNVIKTGLNTHLIPKFIELGANVCYLDEDGNTPLHLAAAKGNSIATFFLIKVPAVNINAINFIGDTPLHLASGNGHVTIVNALIAAKAQINVVNSLGQTPLFQASSNGHLEVVKTLIAAHANLDICTPLGTTALSQANDNGYPEIVEALKIAGVHE